MTLQRVDLGAVVLTGATGFIGKPVLASLLASKHRCVISAARNSSGSSGVGGEHLDFDLLQPFDLQSSLHGVFCVVHMAGRVHVMSETSSDPLEAFRRSNVNATLTLARQAASAGVRRFVFVSSIKVNGERTALHKAFSADDPPRPEDPYGVSKMEAELGLRAIGAETGMEVVIIRPVLVYGPGVKANFRSMMSWLTKGVPLPLGAINNKRSLVALENLVDLIVTCIDHPAAANQTFLVSDDEDVSTSELLLRMGVALGRPARLLPVPMWLLSCAASLFGKRAVAQRLCGSLQVDISKTKALLNWVPPVTVDAALEKTAKHFLEHKSR